MPTLDEMRDAWLARYGGELSRSSLLRAGVTRKKRFRPSEQFRPDVSAKRDAFWKAIAKVPFDNLIFIDESGCNVAMTPSYGRASRGERVLDHKPANWGENLSASSTPSEPTAFSPIKPSREQ